MGSTSIEAKSIEAAKQRYPDIGFLACDVCDVGRFVDERPDVVCMFNAYYCFDDQFKALRSLRALALPDTRMIIFDHVDRGGYSDNPLMDAGEQFLPNPLKLSEVGDCLVKSGWRSPQVRELNDEYVGWYTHLVDRIESARGDIIDLSGERGYEHVLRLYSGLRDAAQHGRLGAAIITTTAVS